MCRACGQICLTSTHLLNHMKSSLNPDCRTGIETCLYCYREFVSSESLNRHLGQSATCRLAASKPDIASIVPFKPTTSTNSAKIIPVQSSQGKISSASHEFSVPSSICVNLPYESGEESVNTSFSSNQQKHLHEDYFSKYLDRADEFVQKIFKDESALFVRIVPDSEMSVSDKTTSHQGSKYDPYILSVSEELQELSPLFSENGFQLNEYCPLSVNVCTWIDYIVEAIDADKNRNQNDFCSFPSSHIPSSCRNYDQETTIKRSEVWKCLRAHIKIYNLNDEMKICLDSIFSSSSESSSLETENMLLPEMQENQDMNEVVTRKPIGYRNQSNPSHSNAYESGTGSFSTGSGNSQSMEQHNTEIPFSSSIQGTHPPYATYMLKHEARSRLEHQEAEVFNDRDVACLDLFSILQKGGIPIHIFDDIQRWALKHSKTLEQCGGKSRSTFLRDLRIKVYGYPIGPFALIPSSTSITLGSGKEIMVTKFPTPRSL